MKRLVLCISLAITAAYALPVVAQSWPTRPIRVIVPYPPGGGTDLALRTIAEPLAMALGQPIIVENRTGASGRIGTEFVMKSTPDGYTLLGQTDSMVLQSFVTGANYDALTDFVAILKLVRNPVVLAASASSPFNDLADVIRAAKANPGGISYASSGVGSQQNILGEWVSAAAGIKLNHIPYNGGSQAVTNLVGGQVPLAFLGSTPLMPFYQSGKIRLLAQSFDTRSSNLPAVPTFKESGLGEVSLEQWVGVFAPRGTPEPIVERLRFELAKIQARPEVRERYRQLGVEPLNISPVEFAAALTSDASKYRALLKRFETVLK